VTRPNEVGYALRDAGIHAAERQAEWRAAQRPRPSLGEAISLGMGLAYARTLPPATS